MANQSIPWSTVSQNDFLVQENRQEKLQILHRKNISVFFKNTSPKTTAPVSEWILTEMGSFITRKEFQEKPNSQSWFTLECAATIAHHNHYYNTYHRKRCRRTLAAFRTVRRHCKGVLENARCRYAQVVLVKIQLAKVESKQFGSLVFWKISNQIKVSVSTYYYKGVEVISSSSEWQSSSPLSMSLTQH